MSAHATPDDDAHARIAVTVHDDALTRAGLTCLLRSSPMIDLCDPGDVAVLLVDRLQRPVLAYVRKLSRTQRVVLIVASLTEPQLLRALDNGVSAILFRREVTRERLLGAVRAAARDDRHLPADAVDQLVEAIRRLRRPAAGLPGTAHPPTDRELAVLALLADGLGTREIAKRLAISERTVKNVLHGVTVRFRLRNRAHAVAHALREGYL